nr:MAG TPA: Protein of unknown function (DUF3165) [Caudoviricetes sp.]
MLLVGIIKYTVSQTIYLIILFLIVFFYLFYYPTSYGCIIFCNNLFKLISFFNSKFYY